MTGIPISAIPHIGCVGVTAASIASTCVLPAFKIRWDSEIICIRQANHVVTGNPL